MPPVVFLDIEGVLLTESSPFDGGHVLQAFGNLSFRREPVAPEELWPQLFVEQAVQNIRGLHDEFRPIWVISSSWRRWFERNQIVEILSRTGLRCVADNLHDRWPTPWRLRDSNRVHEISGWCIREDYSGGAIAIDDTESGAGLESVPWDIGVVLCDPAKGFDVEAYERARSAVRIALGLE